MPFKYLSWIRYAWNAMMVNEFRNIDRIGMFPCKFTIVICTLNICQLECRTCLHTSINPEKYAKAKLIKKAENRRPSTMSMIRTSIISADYVYNN